VRQLIRRLRACEAGAGVVEYAFLIAVLALGLVGILTLFRNSVGDVMNRTATNVETQTAGGYGSVGAYGAPGGGAVAQGPAADTPDSSSAAPDSSAASGGPTVAATRPAVR
jgi:Flp pilus assembly pilin Flp